MQIRYSFLENTEPTDEQLHLLMQEVAAEVKIRAKKSETEFFKQLRLLVEIARSQKTHKQT
jgi:hypothetical protein